jgi:hypothetical protein
MPRQTKYLLRQFMLMLLAFLFGIFFTHFQRILNLLFAQNWEGAMTELQISGWGILLAVVIIAGLAALSWKYGRREDEELAKIVKKAVREAMGGLRNDIRTLIDEIRADRQRDRIMRRTSVRRKSSHQR